MVGARKGVSGGYETVSAQDLEQIGQLARADKDIGQGYTEGSDSVETPPEE